MPIYEGTIVFRFRSPSQQVAELYIDGLCTALRHNKPEISTPSVRWNISEVSDDLTQFEGELRDAPRAPDSERIERERLGLPQPEDDG